MANHGKDLQIGGGSRRPSQARAEDAARRSRKRADERRWRRDEEGRRPASAVLPEPAGPAQMALLDLSNAAWEFGRAIDELGRRVECPPRIT